MTGPDLFAELDAGDCWCGRDQEECRDLGGCRWTRALAAARRAERERIARDALAEADRGAKSGLDRIALRAFAERLLQGQDAPCT